MWAELQEARDRAQVISRKVEKLLKEQSSLMKNEIPKYSEELIADIDKYLKEIENEYKQMIKDIERHRKALHTKSKFLRRHNSRYRR